MPNSIVHVTFLVFFVILFLLATQQLLIQSWAQKDFVLYRFLLVMSVLNEIIVLALLFGGTCYIIIDVHVLHLPKSVFLVRCIYHISYIDPSEKATVASRGLIWANLLWGSYILYKLGKMGADGLYKQMTANKV